MNKPTATPLEASAKWYCVQTRPKSEHIAAAGLDQYAGVETYCPRIRYQKVTKRGKIWFKEALFPNYIFAKFEVVESLRLVRSSQAVLRVICFGDLLGEISESIIEQIRQEMGGEQVREVSIPVLEGDEVEVAQGPFAGMKGIVTRLLSGDQRVNVLMEILGQENQVEISTANLKSKTLAREVLTDPE